MVSIGFLGAFLGGVLAILSPCSALLLPAFFAYAFTSKQQLAARTLVFFLGLACVLVPVGVGAGNLGGLLTQHRGTLITIGGWVIIALGVYTFLGFGFNIPGLSSLASRVRGSGWVSVFLLGEVYGFAGFCAGPLLGAVLTTAVVGGNPAYGALVMALYALGMTVPLFLMALVWDRWDIGSRTWLRGRAWQLGPLRLNTMSMISGALFIFIGLLFITSYGTATLPSLLSTDTQFNIQTWAGRWSERYTNAQVLLAVAVIAELILLVKILRDGRKAEG